MNRAALALVPLLIITAAEAKSRKPVPTVAPEYRRAVKPTAILFNGAGQFQPDIITPLKPLALDLEKQGWRVVITNHLTIGLDTEEPVLLIGHSAGGATAYEYAQRQVEQVKFHPTVITLDAALWWGSVHRCPVKTCINLRTPNYPRVAGATNIDAANLTDAVIPHVTVAFANDARKVVLRYTAGLVRP